MSRAYSRVYQLCWKIRDQRKEEYLIKEYEARIDNVTNQIIDAMKITDGYIDFEKFLDDGTMIQVNLSEFMGTIGIVQIAFPTDVIRDYSIPWILPGIDFYNHHTWVIDVTDTDKIRQIAKNLIDQGYKIDKSIYNRYMSSFS